MRNLGLFLVFNMSGLHWRGSQGRFNDLLNRLYLFERIYFVFRSLVLLRHRQIDGGGRCLRGRKCAI